MIREIASQMWAMTTWLDAALLSLAVFSVVLLEAAKRFEQRLVNEAAGAQTE